MELKSVSGLTTYAADLDQTAAFYEMLGFRLGNRDEKTLTVYVNWFSIQFVAADQEDKTDFLDDAQAAKKGEGLYINLKVEDVDATHKELVDKGLKPSTEPRDWPWGNREFVIRDPDGYKLVFWQKK